MGVAQSFSSARMLAIEKSTVTTGQVVGDDLVLRTRDNTPINAGNVRGPVGPRGDGGNRWSPSTAYVINDVVGYAGRVWKAKSANTNKVPALNTVLWQPLFGGNYTAWAQDDPYFQSDSLSANWVTFWASGTPVPTTTLTSVAGEFETGKQALKISFAASSGQRLFQADENVVRPGEYITVEVRAKKTANVAGGTLDVALVQNDTGRPEPFEGETSTSMGASQNVTTAWATYTWNLTVPANTKPRTKIHILATQYSANAVDVVIDRIEVRRQPAAPPPAPPIPGTPISRHTASQVKETNIPNNGGLYTAAHFASGFVVPAGAVTALVSVSWNAHAATNAACNWYPTLRLSASGDIGMGSFRVHNEANPALNMGVSFAEVYRVDSYIGQTLQVYVNATNDTGSGAWIHMNMLHVIVTFCF